MVRKNERWYSGHILDVLSLLKGSETVQRMLVELVGSLDTTRLFWRLRGCTTVQEATIATLDELLNAAQHGTESSDEEAVPTVQGIAEWCESVRMVAVRYRMRRDGN